jgi:hypothetical protein
MTITLQARVISVKIAQHQVLNPDFDRSGPDSYSNRRMVYADIEGMLSVSLDVPKLNGPVSHPRQGRRLARRQHRGDRLHSCIEQVMIVKAILALGVLLDMGTGTPPRLLEMHSTTKACLDRATALNDNKTIVDDAKKAGVAFFCLEIKLPGTPT